MKQVVLVYILLLLVVVECQTPRDRALALLAQMTLNEKLAMLSGTSGPYVGYVKGNTRLGIPAINLSDGPQGVGNGMVSVTCWPSALAVASTWNVGTMYNWGSAMGVEQRGKGSNVMLGPNINIVRTPRGGRVFEMFSEDPYLTAQLARASVSGIQSQKVIATAKHYINNEQEYQRNYISITVDERTNWEIYYPPFMAAVEANVGAVMCSYNKINGKWACENPDTLGDLKNKMGFQGWVMSDWFATHTTVQSALAGMDMEMPNNAYFGPLLNQSVTNLQVPVSRIDDMVTRILTAFYSVGAMNATATGSRAVNVLSPERKALAYSLAAGSTVLLQNTNNFLPLPSNVTGKRIAVVGDAGDRTPFINGGGSGAVTYSYAITPLAGLKSRIGTTATVSYYPTTTAYSTPSILASFDYVIIVVGCTSTEGSDRTNLLLPGQQNQMITQIAAYNNNTVVVVYGPGPVLMPWAPLVKSILFGFFPGQEAGNALADVLLGAVNPSAKLPVTFAAKEGDWFNTTAQYPGNGATMQYSEKLLVGYRWYEAKNIAPLFPFGHGLSYTSFAYSNLQISGNVGQGWVVTCMVLNTGSRTGVEIVQLYLSYPSIAGEPPKVLRGFTSLELQPGASATATFTLSQASVSIWDVVSHGYTVVYGSFTVHVAASSRDIRLQSTFTV